MRGPMPELAAEFELTAIELTYLPDRQQALENMAERSGSPAVRGILYYENKWGKKPLQQLEEEAAVAIALRALDTAAESDTATGGVDRSGKIFPIIKVVSQDGISTLPEEKIAAIFKKAVA